MISVCINSREVQGQPGTTILELAQKNGIYIPTLCYHSELAPIGACRVCVVKVQGSRTLVASCHTPISPGMVIETNSPEVLAARKVIVELLLASHPEACLVCDKANMCDLRKVATELNIGLPRFRTRRHYHAFEDANPYVVRDLTKCILCRRCVSACREIKKQDVFAIAYRSFDSKVVVDQDQPLEKEVCRSCDVCISVCPVGALSKREREPIPKKGAVTVIRG